MSNLRMHNYNFGDSDFFPTAPSTNCVRPLFLPSTNESLKVNTIPFTFLRYGFTVGWGWKILTTYDC